MKKLLLASTVVLSTSLMASPQIPLNQKIGSFIVEEISTQEFNRLNTEPTPPTTPPTTTPEAPTTPTTPTVGERAEQAGKVITAAKDMVALGEAIYELVKKGKPTNVTTYAPISVIPRDPISKEIADVFDLEGFSMPVERSFAAKVKDGSGKDVVNFSYKVIYSYGGSYNGVGKYLTNVMIVPGAIRTTHGWEFNATMKLAGIMNHGSKANPVAGASIAIKYQMNSWRVAFERNDTIHVTGNGELKTFNAN